ncbi:MAG: YdcF family protein [Flavobacteriales bacterium]|nr:YdcF family protein [Flavobacteriales bacterium]
MKELIIVLGGGINEKGELPAWVHSRLDLATSLFRDTENCQLIMSGKGRDNYPISEAKAMTNYLIEKGVHAEAILEESLSEDTIQNAYFTRLLHIDPKGIRKFKVVTNEFHMARASHIFNWVFGSGYEIEFVRASDKQIDHDNLSIRRNTEEELLRYHLRELSTAILHGDLEGVKRFIFDQADDNALAYKAFTAPYTNVRALY